MQAAEFQIPVLENSCGEGQPLKPSTTLEYQMIGRSGLASAGYA